MTCRIDAIWQVGLSQSKVGCIKVQSQANDIASDRLEHTLLPRATSCTISSTTVVVLPAQAKMCIVLLLLHPVSQQSQTQSKPGECLPGKVQESASMPSNFELQLRIEQSRLACAGRAMNECNVLSRQSMRDCSTL